MRCGVARCGKRAGRAEASAAGDGSGVLLAERDGGAADSRESPTMTGF
jgi:hypothetical protein